MWVTGSHVPYGKISIKPLKNKKELSPWGVMHLLIENCIRASL